MTHEQIIANHIQSLEIQNRGYRKQLEAEKSELLCRGYTRSIAENEVIIGVLKQGKDNEVWELKLYDKLKLLFDVWSNQGNNNLTELHDSIADFMYDYQTRNIP